MSYITVDVTDKDGNIIPNAEDKVTFKVEGEGKLVGVDNGRQDDHTSSSGKIECICRKGIGDCSIYKESWKFYCDSERRGIEHSFRYRTTTPEKQDTTEEKAISYYEMSKTTM